MFGKSKIIKNQAETIMRQDRRIKQQQKRIIDLENNIEFLASNSKNAKIKELRQ